MRITEVQVNRVAHALRPTLKFDITMMYRCDDELPLDIGATLHADGALIASAVESFDTGAQTLSLRIRDHRYRSDEQPVRRGLLVYLDQAAVDFLDRSREKSGRRDVTLTLNVGVRLLCHRLELHATEDANRSLIRAGNAQEFLEEKLHTESRAIRITSSDWSADYNGPWRQQQFVVVEVPLALDVAGVNAQLEERLREALERAKSAQAHLVQGHWPEACDDLRPLFELFKDPNHAPDLGPLLKADGYTESAIKAFHASIQSLFELSSKFLHSTDKTGKKVQPEIKPQREDAMLAFSVAIAVLNVIGRKLARQS